MTERRPKEEVLKDLEELAAAVEFLAIPERIRHFVEELRDHPDLPEVSRSSHYS